MRTSTATTKATTAAASTSEATTTAERHDFFLIGVVELESR
jgi:hypothetical protein